MISKLYALLDHPRAFRTVQNFLSFGRRPYVKGMLKLIRPAPHHKVLDLGCGPGSFSDLFQCFYVGMDLNFKFLLYGKSLNKTNSGLRCFLQGKATELCFKEQSFDYVFSTSFFHHLSDDEAAETIAAVKRILTRNGKAYVFEPIYPVNRWNIIGTAIFLLDRGRYQRDKRALDRLMFQNGLREAAYQIPPHESFPHEHRIYVYDKGEKEG